MITAFQIVQYAQRCLFWGLLWGVKNPKGLCGPNPWCQIQHLLLCLVFPAWWGPAFQILSFCFFVYKLWYPHLPPRAIRRRKREDKTWPCSVTGSIFCKCMVKVGSTLITRRAEGPLLVGGFPLHWSLEEPVVSGLSHQRHRGGGAHYYAAFTPCLGALVFSD